MIIQNQRLIQTEYLLSSGHRFVIDESITDSIDKDSQQTSKIYEKIIKNITETWLFSEIMELSFVIDWTLPILRLTDHLNNQTGISVVG